MEGCDIVLGTQWMRELDLVRFNFKKLQDRFSYNGKEYKWQGLLPSDFQILNDKNSTKEFISTHLHFMLFSALVQTPTLSQIQPNIQHLFDKFPTITSTHNSLPPAREYDHQISLLDI